MNKFVKLTGLSSALGLASVQAFAAIPATVTTAIDGAQADGETLGYALMVMAIVVGLVFWLKSKGGR
jgi:hypothetical protein